MDGLSAASEDEDEDEVCVLVFVCGWVGCAGAPMRVCEIQITLFIDFSDSLASERGGAHWSALGVLHIFVFDDARGNHFSHTLQLMIVYGSLYQCPVIGELLPIEHNFSLSKDANRD